MADIYINTIKGDLELDKKNIKGNLELGNKSINGSFFMPKTIYLDTEWGRINGDIHDQVDLMELLSVINCGTSTEVI